MEWDGEIVVHADRVVARCLYPACEFSMPMPEGDRKLVVREARYWLGVHQYEKHIQKGTPNRINLVFGEGVTL
jgi:hypothetical protein